MAKDCRSCKEVARLEAALATTERAYREQKESAEHEEKTRMDWQGMYHVAAERAERAERELAAFKEENAYLLDKMER